MKHPHWGPKYVGDHPLQNHGSSPGLATYWLYPRGKFPIKPSILLEIFQPWDFGLTRLIGVNEGINGGSNGLVRGFSHWNLHLGAFLRSCDRHGGSNLEIVNGDPHWRAYFSRVETTNQKDGEGNTRWFSWEQKNWGDVHHEKGKKTYGNQPPKTGYKH